MIPVSLMKRESFIIERCEQIEHMRIKRQKLRCEVDLGQAMEIEEEPENELSNAYFDYLDSLNRKEVIRWMKEYTLACKYNRIMIKDS